MVSGTGSVLANVRRRNKRFPGSPRCKQCYLPPNHGPIRTSKESHAMTTRNDTEGCPR